MQLKKYQMKTNIIKVLKNKRERAEASYIITPEGKGFYIYKGEKIPDKIFNKRFPTEVKKIMEKGENPCRKYAY